MIVAITLAIDADEERISAISLSELCIRTGLEHRTVRRALLRLRRMLFLRLVRPRSGRLPDAYRICTITGP
jgi:DNA-binding transcriptional ArsR family regulator